MEEAIYHLLEKLKRPGLLKRGAQESLVSIEKGKAHLVIVARDASEKVREFILSRARLRGIPSLSVSEGKKLGKASGLRVGAIAVAVLDPEAAREILSATGTKDLEPSGLSG